MHITLPKLTYKDHFKRILILVMFSSTTHVAWHVPVVPSSYMGGAQYNFSLSHCPSLWFNKELYIYILTHSPKRSSLVCYC